MDGSVSSKLIKKRYSKLAIASLSISSLIILIFILETASLNIYSNSG